jgi:uncharacterized membrane protein YadS
VVGAALTYANMYGVDGVVHTATVTKLARNLCLAPALPLLAWSSLRGPNAGTRPALKQLVPLFVVGFLGAAAVRSGGDAWIAHHSSELAPEITQAWRSSIAFLGGPLASGLLGTAMAGVGLKTNLAVFHGVGWRPFACGFLGASLVASTGLLGAVLLIP